MELRDLKKDEIITNKPQTTNNDFSEDALGPPVMKDYKKERSKKTSAFQIFLYDKNKIFRDIMRKMTKKQKLFFLICVIIIFLNFIIKLFISHSIGYSLYINFSNLKPFVSDVLNKKWYYLILYYINLLFLIPGFLIFSCEGLIELIIRFYFLSNPFEKTIKILIVENLFFFICLGLIPETSMTMFNFKNKNNIIIPFFKAKLYTQPILLISSIIYGTFLFTKVASKDRKKKLRLHFNIYKNISIRFLQLKLFRWNNFKDETKITNIKENKDNVESEDKDLDESNLSEKSKLSEEDEGKIFVIKKRYIAFILWFLIFSSPFLNGVFGYGYYIFFFRDSFACSMFKFDLILNFLFGYCLLNIVN